MSRESGEDSTVKFSINGQELEAAEGTSILEAARANNIFIPALCFLEGLSLAGSCRLCFVEIQGYPKPVTACSTALKEGMVIETNSDALRKSRRFLLEMLFAAGHHVCAYCVSNGHCELQNLAMESGLSAIRFPQRKEETPLDLSHEKFGFDPNRCVLCTRCVRACDEISGNGLWAVLGHDSDAHLEINMGAGWGLSPKCTSCGACVMACPTAALFNKQASAAEMRKDCALLVKLKAKKEAANE
jgi:bidirectional [NiFe] hydrogenase diaphorase subunit